MRILVDADSCPVWKLACEQASVHKIPCLLFCDDAHRFAWKGAQIIQVSTGDNSADLALANQVQVGDLVITQDYGLAALCLAKGADALRQDGVFYTKENIDILLQMRYLSDRARRSGIHTKGPPKRQKKEDVVFLKALNRYFLGNMKTEKE